MRIRPYISIASHMKAIFIFFISHTAHAAMYVYPIETSVRESGTSQIRVISQNNEVEFVRINLKKVINPGGKNEREVGVDMSDVNQIIITPQKIALSAGGERVVRIVSMNLPVKETTWRVYFEGVSENEFNSYYDKNNQAGKAAKVGVDIIWGALIHVAPIKSVASLKYIPSTGKITNDGTIRIPVTEVGVCKSSSECKWKKKAFVLYPGGEIYIPDMKLPRYNTYKIKYLNWIKNTSEEMELPVSQAN